MVLWRVVLLEEFGLFIYEGFLFRNFCSLEIVFWFVVDSIKVYGENDICFEEFDFFCCLY